MIEFVRRSTGETPRPEVDSDGADGAGAGPDPPGGTAARRLEQHQIDNHLDELRSGTWHCGGCSARVTARRSYRRADGTRVLAHFAALPSDDGSAPHDAGCPFEPPTRAEGEGADARNRSAEQADHGGVAAYQERWTEPDRAWVLSIGEPDRARSSRAGTDALRGAVDGPHGKARAASTARGTTGPGRAVGRAGTVGSALDVLELVRHFGRHPLDLSRFTARWGSGDEMRRLSWGDLYYPPGRHHLLLTRATSRDLPPHPVAVAGRVAHWSQRANRRHGGEDTVAYLSLAPPLREQHRLVVRVSPRVAQSARWPAPETDTEPNLPLLVVARLEAFTPAGDHTPTYCTAWVDQPDQLLVLDQDEAID